MMCVVCPSRRLRQAQAVYVLVLKCIFHLKYPRVDGYTWCMHSERNITKTIMHTHSYSNIIIFVYVYKCVCVCVFFRTFIWLYI